MNEQLADQDSTEGFSNHNGAGLMFPIVQWILVLDQNTQTVRKGRKKKKKGKSFSKRSHAIHFVYLYDDILMAHGHVIDDANFGRITGGIIVVYISLCLTLVHVPFML